jgi:Na+-driven multidrug efflux pump
LPFNVTHLGPAAYGVWLLAASVTIHFSVLDLGFGGAFVRFVAQYRARRNPRGLNEIASTLLFVYAAVGCLAYLVVMLVAANLDALFRVTAEQASLGRWLLLIIGVQVALNFPFSVSGGVVNGFQRYNVNAGVAIGSSVAVAAVNVAILTAGYGLVPLVLATTSVRIAASELQGSVAVPQILAVAIMIRVGAGTATTILKGAGMHRLMASVASRPDWPTSPSASRWSVRSACAAWRSAH